MVYHAFSQKEAKELDVQVRCLAGALGATEVMAKMAQRLLNFPTVYSSRLSRHVRFNPGLLFCWPAFPESGVVNWDFLRCVTSPCGGHQAVLP